MFYLEIFVPHLEVAAVVVVLLSSLMIISAYDLLLGWVHSLQNTLTSSIRSWTHWLWCNLLISIYWFNIVEKTNNIFSQIGYIWHIILTLLLNKNIWKSHRIEHCEMSVAASSGVKKLIFPYWTTKFKLFFCSSFTYKHRVLNHLSLINELKKKL